MPDEYEKLRPYWEAWKANNERPSDPHEAKNWDGMREILKAVAGDNTANADMGALEYILNSRSRWLSHLISLPTSDAQTKQLRLFRGITDEEAIRLRKSLNGPTPFYERAHTPISYSIDQGVALSFAIRGHICGCVYSVLVPPDSVIFSDLDCHYQEGWLHLEKEVVVWHKEPTLIRPADVIVSAVAPKKPIRRTRSSRSAWDKERQRLKELEGQS